MDIRCGSCSKLFRVADEKIAGKGVRFKCSKCGETITVTKQDLEMDLLAREGGEEVPVFHPPSAAPPPPQPAAPSPQPHAEPEAREYTPPPPEPEESGTQEAQHPDAPPAGLEDFDFSAPDVAAQHAQQRDAGLTDFSFGDQGGLEEQDAQAGETDEATGEVSISEEDAAAAEDAFSFPTDMISEPKRKPAFAEAAEAAAGAEASEQGGASAPDQSPEAGLDLSGLGEEGPDLTPEPGPAPPISSPSGGPVFTPPPRKQAPSAPPAEEEIDLGAALSIPRTDAGEPGAGMEGAESGADTLPFEDAGAFAASAAQDGEMHPLASGNATGAVAGIVCAIPLVLLLSFGLGIIAAFLPFLSTLPIVHLMAVAGAATISLAILIGIVVAVLQAKAGRKLFFLINILVGSLFGALFGSAMTAVIMFASGAPIDLAQLSSGAIAGAIPAFVLSVLLAVVRRIMVFTKDETFSASLSGGQKAGLVLSLLIILGAGYGVGTFTGTFGKAVQTEVKQVPNQAPVSRPAAARITPDGLEIVDAAAYIERETGDLVITGSVRNTLNEPKAGWYLDVGVLDGTQARVATVIMVNGVQFLTKNDYALLEKRNKDVAKLKAQMALAVLSGEVPARSSEPFELHLMEPPAGMASILPVLKAFDPAATFEQLTAEMQGR